MFWAVGVSPGGFSPRVGYNPRHGRPFLPRITAPERPPGPGRSTKERLMLKEFKEFIMRGNVLDLAVGIIIGAAFGKSITSFVSNILMPPVGLLLGKVDFSSLFINLSGKDYPSVPAAKAAGAPTINYGLFLNTVLDFLIVAFVIF